MRPDNFIILLFHYVTTYCGDIVISFNDEIDSVSSFIILYSNISSFAVVKFFQYVSSYSRSTYHTNIFGTLFLYAFSLPRYACLLSLMDYVLQTKNLTHKGQDITEIL